MLCGRVIPHAFLHTVCVKVHVCKCACVGVCLLCQLLENLSFIVSVGGKHEGHTLAYVHAPDPNNPKTVPFPIAHPSGHPVSVGTHTMER